MHTSTLWLGIGFLGQLFFSCRFVLQWLASERVKRSVVPISFWLFSIVGGTILLVYALYRRDPVFVFGQASGVFIYIRNLMLIRKEQNVK